MTPNGNRHRSSNAKTTLIHVDGAPWHVPRGFGAAYARVVADPAPVDVLSDMLTLIGYDARPETLDRWTVRMRVARERMVGTSLDAGGSANAARSLVGDDHRALRAAIARGGVSGGAGEWSGSSPGVEEATNGKREGAGMGTGVKALRLGIGFVNRRSRVQISKAAPTGSTNGFRGQTEVAS